MAIMPINDLDQQLILQPDSWPSATQWWCSDSNNNTFRSLENAIIFGAQNPQPPSSLLQVTVPYAIVSAYAQSHAYTMVLVFSKTENIYGVKAFNPQGVDCTNQLSWTVSPTLAIDTSLGVANFAYVPGVYQVTGTDQKNNFGTIAVVIQ